MKNVLCLLLTSSYLWTCVGTTDLSKSRMQVIAKQKKEVQGIKENTINPLALGTVHLLREYIIGKDVNFKKNDDNNTVFPKHTFISGNELYLLNDWPQCHLTIFNFKSKETQSIPSIDHYILSNFTKFSGVNCLYVKDSIIYIVFASKITLFNRKGIILSEIPINISVNSVFSDAQENIWAFPTDDEIAFFSKGRWMDYKDIKNHGDEYKFYKDTMYSLDGGSLYLYTKDLLRAKSNKLICKYPDSYDALFLETVTKKYFVWLAVSKPNYIAIMDRKNHFLKHINTEDILNFQKIESPRFDSRGGIRILANDEEIFIIGMRNNKIQIHSIALPL